VIEPWIASDTTVIAEAGTAFYGAVDLRLPKRCDLLGSPVWSSIGYTIPATLGGGLARPDRRPVLFIGDGSAQLTVQELGTVLAHDLAPVIFVLNNGGYTIERAIRNPEADYQDIVPWNWTAIPGALGGSAVNSATVSTTDELVAVLRRASAASRTAFFIEVLLPKLDAPRLLVEIASGIATANSHAPVSRSRLDVTRGCDDQYARNVASSDTMRLKGWAAHRTHSPPACPTHRLIDPPVVDESSFTEGSRP
jgi:TPP-dependent 2-oxoacid decarboxylase